MPTYYVDDEPKFTVTIPNPQRLSPGANPAFVGQPCFRGPTLLSVGQPCFRGPTLLGGPELCGQPCFLCASAASIAARTAMPFAHPAGVRSAVSALTSASPSARPARVHRRAAAPFYLSRPDPSRWCRCHNYICHNYTGLISTLPSGALACPPHVHARVYTQPGASRRKLVRILSRLGYL